MISKAEIIKECKAEIESRIQNTQSAIDSARESANNEQKSTAGDKHDTARAMAQFEQEKLSKQLMEQLKLKEITSRIDIQQYSESIKIGSLIELSTGWFFVGVGLGKIQVKNNSVFCVSAVSPIGKLLIHKKKGDSVNLNGIQIAVKEVY